MNWRKYTDNPVDLTVRSKILTYVNSKRHIDYQKDFKDYLIDQVKGKKVLDIGVCEHDLSHMNADGWKHKYIKEASKSCVGVDIIEPLVNILNTKGYDIKCVDATSDVYLGEKFEVVVIGDVIEHVDNPVALLKFAKRHLSDGGKIIVSTPNPHSFAFTYMVWRESTAIVNFEHTLWVSPSISVELAYRSQLELHRYCLLMKGSNPIKNLIKRMVPGELIAKAIVYEFVNPH